MSLLMINPIAVCQVCFILNEHIVPLKVPINVTQLILCPFYKTNGYNERSFEKINEEQHM